MLHKVTLSISRMALILAGLAGLGLLGALVWGEGHASWFTYALVAALTVRVTAEVNQAYLWRQRQPPGRLTRRRTVNRGQSRTA